MKKTEVYSWRVASSMKQALEEEAREQGVSLAAMLERIAGDWLEKKRASAADDAEEQRRLHAAAKKAIGAIDDAPDLAVTVSERMREVLGRRYGR